MADRGRVAAGRRLAAPAAHVARIPMAAIGYAYSVADDNSLKSSFELAMERLRKQDAEAGIDARLVTDAQKAAIAEVRNFYEAKLAEAEVLHQSKMRASLDLAERDALAQQYRRDRERLTSERDAKIEKIRRQT
jgi:hypothetical protein